MCCPILQMRKLCSLVPDLCSPCLEKWPTSLVPEEAEWTGRAFKASLPKHNYYFTRLVAPWKTLLERFAFDLTGSYFKKPLFKWYFWKIFSGKYFNKTVSCMRPWITV